MAGESKLFLFFATAPCDIESNNMGGRGKMALFCCCPTASKGRGQSTAVPDLRGFCCFAMRLVSQQTFILFCLDRYEISLNLSQDPAVFEIPMTANAWQFRGQTCRSFLDHMQLENLNLTSTHHSDTRPGPCRWTGRLPVKEERDLMTMDEDADDE